MTDFSKILTQAKEIEAKVKESQDKIKKIEVEGSSGGGAVKVILNGESEINKISISDNTFKDDRNILEDLIMAAHNDAKKKIKG